MLVDSEGSVKSYLTFLPVKLWNRSDYPFAVRESSKILDVDVSAEPGVISEIPAGVVRVFVNHDGIRVPKPIAHIADFVREDAEVPAVEPKTIRAAAAKMIHVASSETAGEAAVLPGMLHVKTSVIAAGVADPFVVPSVHMGRVGMTFGVAEVARLVGAAFFGSRGRGVLFRPSRGGMFFSTTGMHGWFRSMRGDVSAADLGVTSAVLLTVLLRQT